MSRWILKTEISPDPMSFEQLAQLLADGGISETDLVRAEDNEHWQYVDSVIGLSRAAEKLRSTCRTGIAPSACIADSEVNTATASKVATSKTLGTATNGVSQFISPAHKIQPSASVPAQRLSWLRVSVFCLGFGIAAWCGWSYWYESYRFPKPAYMAQNSEPLTLPWIGAVSGFQATLLAVDTVALIAFAVWWFRRNRGAK